MNTSLKSSCHTLLIVFAAVACIAQTSRSRQYAQQMQPAAAPQPVELRREVSVPFRFAAYGDMRFHDPKDTEASNPPVRQAIVQAIADAHPAFISIGGDIVYNGYDADDWKAWDSETSVWRESKIPIYPALGNHDLHGDQNVALGNYF
jgi:acid phosphatase type 7